MSFDELTYIKFCDIYCSRLCTEFWTCEYPEFKFTDEFFSGDFFVEYVKKNVNKYNPTDFLNQLIDCVIIGDRYAYGAKNEIQTMISILIEHGAVPDIQKLVQRNFPDCNKASFEDEACCYQSRGILIDILGERGFDFSKCADWCNIRSVYWEYVDEYKNNIYYKEGTTQEEKTKYELNRLGVIKFYSRHLRTTYANHDDSYED